MMTITQAEFNKQFAEYVKDKKVNKDNLLEHIIDYEKILKKQGITVRAGFSVDQTGKITYDN
jgi:hypothetical protein